MTGEQRLPTHAGAPWVAQVPRWIMRSGGLTSAEKIHLAERAMASKRTSKRRYVTDEERSEDLGVEVDTVRATRYSLRKKGLLSVEWSQRAGDEKRSHRGRYVCETLNTPDSVPTGHGGFVEVDPLVISTPELTPADRVVLLGLIDLRSAFRDLVMESHPSTWDTSDRWRWEVLEVSSAGITKRTGNIRKAAALSSLERLRDCGCITMVSRPRKAPLIVVHEAAGLRSVNALVDDLIKSSAPAAKAISLVRSWGATVDACGAGRCDHSGGSYHRAEALGVTYDMIDGELDPFGTQLVRVALLGRDEAVAIATRRRGEELDEARARAGELINARQSRRPLRRRKLSGAAAWRRIVALAAEVRPALGAALQHATPVEVSADRIALAFEPASFFGRQIESGSGRVLLAELVSRALDTRPTIEVVYRTLTDAEPLEVEHAPPATPPPTSASAEAERERDAELRRRVTPALWVTIEQLVEQLDDVVLERIVSAGVALNGQELADFVVAVATRDPRALEALDNERLVPLTAAS